MGKAIAYALAQWSGLDNYLADGRVELCNNLVENAIRPLKLGSKNYLFFGSQRGGELACVAYTLIANSNRHGLALNDYLTEAMKALVGIRPEPSRRTNSSRHQQSSTPPQIRINVK